MQKKIRSYLYSCAFVRVFRFLDAAKLDNICKNANQIHFFYRKIVSSKISLQHFKCSERT